MNALARSSVRTGVQQEGVRRADYFRRCAHDGNEQGSGSCGCRACYRLPAPGSSPVGRDGQSAVERPLSTPSGASRRLSRALRWMRHGAMVNGCHGWVSMGCPWDAMACRAPCLGSKSTPQCSWNLPSSTCCTANGAHSVIAAAVAVCGLARRCGGSAACIEHACALLPRWRALPFSVAAAATAAPHGVLVPWWQDLGWVVLHAGRQRQRRDLEG